MNSYTHTESSYIQKKTWTTNIKIIVLLNWIFLIINSYFAYLYFGIMNYIEQVIFPSPCSILHPLNNVSELDDRKHLWQLLLSLHFYS